MKISIITVTHNSGKTIRDTISSVLSQNYQDLEYIFVDGGSTDDTSVIVKSYGDKIAKFISEPDNGIYDAMNKGISIATGDIIGILNSDDFYRSDTVLKDVSVIFKENDVDACYGDIEYIKFQDTDKVVRIWKAGEYKRSKLNSGWIMPHPAFFVKKEIYNKYGLFNLDFKIAADYELMLRFLLKGLITVKHINKTLVSMREGGFSAKGYCQRRLGWKELKKAWTVNGLSVPMFFIIRRILFKINQYL